MGLEGKCDLIASVLDSLENKFSKINPGLIDTGSNLKTDVVKGICKICDVDGSHFDSQKFFIDQLLLKRRNAIAHGAWEVVDENEMGRLVSDTLSLMAHFRTLLESKIDTKAYLST